MTDPISANPLPIVPASAGSRASPDVATTGQAGQAPSVNVAPPGDRSEKHGAFDEKTLDKIATRLVAPNSRLAISEDDVIRRFIYKFVDPNNGKVLRQYPHQMVVDSLHAIEKSYQRFLDKHA